MITVTIRRQGGAAVMTIPSNVLKMLDVEVGATLALEVDHEVLRVRPVRPGGRKRYPLAELLRGVTPDVLEELQAATAEAREGDPVGREVA